MKFIDTAFIKLKAGNGGPGAVSFRREKYVPKGGPDGGDGGDGGDIILQASDQLRSLLDVKIKSNYEAASGHKGDKKNRAGSRGKDLIIKLPCGTLIFDEEKNLVTDIKENGETFIVAKGGKGGKGNARFSTSTNKVPQHAQTGLSGEEKAIHLELRLLAQVGLIGLPNAGKSTLLKELTYASPKIAPYPFTTKIPNLGTLKFEDEELIIADIPGLIKDASKGAGLGLDFLRHIDRTKVLVHLMEALPSEEDCWNNYQTILNELTKSPYELEKKPRLTVLTKIDTVEEDQVQKILTFFKKKNTPILPISVFHKKGINELIQSIRQLHSESTGV